MITPAPDHSGLGVVYFFYAAEASDVGGLTVSIPRPAVLDQSDVSGVVHISATQQGALLLQPLTAGGGPVRDQIRHQLLLAIRSGRLAPDDRLPSSRDLAADVGVSRGTVVEAYGQLVQEGYLTARPGSGTVVAAQPPAAPREGGAPLTWVPATPSDVPVIDLRPGAPDLGAFPRSAWSSATSHVMRTVPDLELGYVPPWGVAVLRTQLAGHLARTRVTDAGPDDVVITSGVTQALTLTCRVLTGLGHVSLAVEDPSNAIQRQVLGRYVDTVLEVPVDEEGLVVDALARTGTRAVLVTPAHQHPTGVALSAARRAALAAWALDVGGVVIEDDYDAEFQFGRSSTPSMQGTDPGHVVHVGSVSKTLAPGLRLGWVLAPPALRAPLASAKRDDDFGTSVIIQHTLARLLETGTYDRHLRGLRRRYSHQRQVLVEALARRAPHWEVRGADAGLHLCVTVPDDVDEVAAVARAAELGLLVLDLGRLRSAAGPKGFVLGYARLREHQADEAVARLARAVQRAAEGAVPVVAPRPPAPADPATSRLGTTSLDYFRSGSTVPV